MKETRKQLIQETGNYTTIIEIWTNHKNAMILPKISDFLWKLCHNQHKIEE